MTTNALVQTRIDSEVKEKATAVLDRLGLTLSDAVRILLTRTANEGALPFAIADPAAHDAWFRGKVLEALEVSRPATSHDQVESEFATRRASARRKADGQI